VHFFWGHSTQTVHPPIKAHVQKARPWDVNWPWKLSLSPEIVPFELYADNKHPTQNTASGAVFLGFLQNPYAKFGNFSLVHAPAHRFTPVISNMVEIGAG